MNEHTPPPPPPLLHPSDDLLHVEVVPVGGVPHQPVHAGHRYIMDVQNSALTQYQNE
jgi:hypothetical protein